MTDPETQVLPTAKQPLVRVIPFANEEVPLPVIVSDCAVSPKLESPCWKVDVASDLSVEVEVVPKRASAKWMEEVAARVDAPVQ